MGIFYIDTEFTNGNFYLGDIFEIACLSENSGYIFHSYINIPTSIPRYIKSLCNVTDTIIRKSPSFHKVINDLIKFINQEEDCFITLVGHGAFLSDFPLLISNCIKYGYDYTRFQNFNFIDSMQVFQSNGYQRSGLSALSNVERINHSAIQDVELLSDIVKKYNIDLTKGYVLNDILQYMNKKMPVSIIELYRLAAESTSYSSLELVLRSYTSTKTALNEKQLYKIVYRYFNSCIYFL